MISRRDFLFTGLVAGFCALFVDLRVHRALADAEGTVPTKTEPGRMEKGQPSRTALRAAIHRAAHQILDDPRVFDDPLALKILGPSGEEDIRADLLRLQRTRYLRAFIALRSRYTEDELACAIQRGVQQYVVLGAGLDTFGCRNPYPVSRLRVFEVDHPATQTWKRLRLGEAKIEIPDSLVFASVDFERQTLADGLNRAGFRSEKPAFFSMLGVVVYLTKTAVMETFKFVASLPPGSEIVFDYGILSSMLSEHQRSARAYLARQVDAIGEPWITYFAPASLARPLLGMGFKEVEYIRPEEANDRYFRDRTDGLCISGSSRLMKARV